MTPASALRRLLLIVCLAVLGSAAASAATIIDHRTADIWQIPASAIQQAKATLRIAYGHTSHGSQLISGMGTSNGQQLDQFMTNNGAPPGLYLWNAGGTGGALDLRDTPFSGASDLGNPDRYAWAQATRTYLAVHPECNVILWSWCGQASTTLDNIDIYLGLMEGLIADYPDVHFVFMTGHLDGTGTNGLLNLANEHIREHCLAHDRILFDFADIESYDPDHLSHYMPLWCNDNCDYDSDGNGTRDRNWALDWQNSHVEGVDWWPSGAAHSQHLNGNLKGYAAWWLWAVLAGWSQCVEAPSGLTATADPDLETIALHWTDHSGAPNEDSFIIQRQANGGPWDNGYATTGPDVTGWVDTGVAAGVYAYRVVAHLEDDGTGAPCNSSPSNVAIAEMTAPGIPAAPSDLTSALQGYDIALAWVDQSDDEESFVLERAIDGSGFEERAILPADTETFVDPGLAPPHTYTYRIKARNGQGDSGYSNETSEYVGEEVFSLVLKQGVGGYTGCRDAFLDSGHPTYNYGGDLYNDVRNNPKSNLAISFDLPEELLGVQIIAARIGLYCWTMTNWQEGQYLELYRLTEPWVEGSADGAYEQGAASWQMRGGDQGEDVAWTTPGGTFDPRLLDHSLIPNAAYYPEFDITGLVQEWASQTAGNHGVLLVNNSLTSTGIKASEYSEYGRPYLEITYSHPVTVPPAPPAARIAGLAVWPNPAPHGTTLRFSLVTEGDGTLGIFAIDGREISTIHRGRIAAGRHELDWSGRDAEGRPVLPGMYFARLSLYGRSESAKILVVR